MKKVSVIEIRVALAIPDGAEPAEFIADISRKAYAFKHELGDVALFNVTTQEVPANARE